MREVVFVPGLGQFSASNAYGAALAFERAPKDTIFVVSGYGPQGYVGEAEADIMGPILDQPDRRVRRERDSRNCFDNVIGLHSVLSEEEINSQDLRIHVFSEANHAKRVGLLTAHLFPHADVVTVPNMDPKVSISPLKERVQMGLSRIALIGIPKGDIGAFRIAAERYIRLRDLPSRAYRRVNEPGGQYTGPVSRPRVGTNG